MFIGGLRDKERSLQVHIENRFESIDTEVEEGSVSDDARIVDHDVEPPVCLDGLVDHGLYRRDGSDTESLLATALPPGFTDLIDDTLCWSVIMFLAAHCW